jgi:hypothetical protein
MYPAMRGGVKKAENPRREAFIGRSSHAAGSFRLSQSISKSRCFPANGFNRLLEFVIAVSSVKAVRGRRGNYPSAGGDCPQARESCASVGRSALSDDLHHARRLHPRYARESGSAIKGRKRSTMREFIYFVHTTLPGIPPFAVMIALFLLISFTLYAWTKHKGYLVIFYSGFLYLLPWLLSYVPR